MNAEAREGRLAAETRADPRWASIVARDRHADGTFCYAVVTTGVYCRPSCTARRARPENVRFFATAAAAERAGYRACKRCCPAEPAGIGRHSAKIAAACRAIEQAVAEPTPVPTLEALARGAGLSPYHFHRLFKEAIGLTPRQYAAACRERRLRAALGRAGTVTDAIVDAGYTSSARLYEHADRLLGMRPTDFRAGGPDIRVRFAIGECTLGSILVAHSQRGVCAISLGDDPDALARELQDRFPRADLIGDDHAFADRVARVIGFIEDPRHGLELPLDIRGTAFQQRVWRALRAIPIGETVSYSEIARRIGAPNATRAVAGACARNPLALAIPCHRVVRQDRGLSGYRWGVARKRALLRREARP